MKLIPLFPRAILRVASRYAAAAALVILCGGVPVAGQAQNSVVPQTRVQAPWSAPVGHRQPSAADLPPDVLRDEGMSPRGMNQQPGAPAPGAPRADASPEHREQHGYGEPLDEGLRICREC
jgi:hypothetical protein